MKNKGFSLMELLIVSLIIGILVAVAIPNYSKSVERSRVTEALTMLHSIYDSCERFAVQNSFDGCANAIGTVTFRKLDITAKGTFSTDGMTFTTANFEYTLANPISATAIKGYYTGASITFDGRTFTCTNGTSGKATVACRDWGAGNNAANWNN